jgi:hypothetical protein
MSSEQRGIFYDPDDHALYVGGVRIDDPEVIKEVRLWASGRRGEPAPDRPSLAAADLSAFVKESVTVGARVLAIAAQTGETISVQDAVRTASDQMSQVVETAVSTAEKAAQKASEDVARTTREAHRSIMDQVTSLVGGENPELLERLRPLLATLGIGLEKQVTESLEKANAALAETSERRHAEIVALVRDVQQEVAVRVAEDAAAATVKGVTTIKGFDYEAKVHSVLTQIAAQTGDEYRETGEFAGRLPRNKKGDGVLAINGGTARIVIECHDGTTKEWGDYLAEAERNRGANAAVGVVRRVEDNHGRAVRIIAPKRIIVAFDPDVDDPELLHTAMLLMKTVALSATGTSSTEGLKIANDHIREALDSIESLDDAKRSANAINGHTQNIERIINKTMTAIQRELHSAMNALTEPVDNSDLEAPADPDNETGRDADETDADVVTLPMHDSDDDDDDDDDVKKTGSEDAR